MTTLRPVSALNLPDIVPGGADMPPPRFIDVVPETLLVDDTYQRNLSERSRKLIRRLVAGWDWCAYKPPVVVEADGGFHIIDGQHTAIAAASHPRVATIPVQVVVAPRQEDRAAAFVKLNRDRIGITPPQLHHALVAAGDEEAVTVEQVCARAGARVLKYPPYDGRYQPGDVMGISTVRALVRRRYALGARRVMEICVRAKLAPASAAALRAVEFLLFDPEHTGRVTDDDLTMALRALGADAERQGRMYAAEHEVPVWRGLATILFRATPKVRDAS